MHTLTRWGAAFLTLSTCAAAQNDFRSVHQPPLSAKTLQFAVADVNGDAIPDVVDRLLDTGLVVRLGRGDGDFGPELPVATSLPTDGAFAVGDLTGDGLDDLVVLREAPELLLLRATGGGGFTPLGTLPLPTLAGLPGRGLTLRDVTGDGVLDVIASVSESVFTVNASVFVGVGDGNFAAGVSTPSIAAGLGDGEQRLRHGDVDGDGFVDLVHRGSGDGFEILFGHGDGSFDAPVSVGDERHEDLLVADLTGDGLDDVLLLAVEGQPVTERRVTLYPSTLGGLPGPSQLVTTHVSRDILAGDVNGDGRVDLLSGADDHHVDLRLQAVDGTLSAPTAIAIPVPHLPGARMQLADVDHDGDIDLLNEWGSYVDADGDILDVLLGDGAGGFGPVFGEHAQDDPTIPAKALRTFVADFDADGFPDLLTLMEQPPSASVRAGRQGRDFGPSLPVDLGVDSSDVLLEVGEVTGDAFPDLVVGVQGEAGDRVQVLAGLGDLSFAPPVVTLANPVDGMALADLDADGLDDLVVDQVNFRVLIARGDGTFQAAPPLDIVAPHDDPWTLADMNGDGRPDLVMMFDVITREFRIHEGLPGATFAVTASARPYVYNPRDFRIAHIDDDEHLDMLYLRGAGTQDPGQYLEVWLGDGALGWKQRIVHGPLPLSNVTSVRAADVDGDSRVDVALFGTNGEAPSHLDDRVLVLTGDGTGQLHEALPSVELPWQLVSAVLHDLDGDGAVDLYAARQLGRSSAVLFNTHGPWTDLLGGLKGAQGVPSLRGFGALQAGGATTLRLANARPFAPAAFVLGFSTLNSPFFGGVMVPTLDIVASNKLTDAEGRVDLSLVWPAGVPAGTEFYVQAWLVDAAAPQGLAGSNALRGVTPATR